MNDATKLQVPDRISEPTIYTSLVIPEEIERLRQMIGAYLDGQVQEALFRRFRLQHGIYGMRNKTGVQMVRLKVPFGRLTARQLETIGHVAEAYASGHGHVTTRQDIQFYSVSLAQVPDMLADLAASGLTTREASGNVIRNITADPLAGVALDEAFDVRPYADAVTRYFLRNPICQNLGRKFKIAFSGSPTDRAYALIHDVGAIARIEEIEGQVVHGFDLFVGGGLGANPRLAQRLEDFTPAERLLPTIEALVRVFDRLGERKNRNKARLKFLLEKLGMQILRELVLQERAVLPMVSAHPYPVFSVAHIGLETPPNRQKPSSDQSNGSKSRDSNYQRWLVTNVVQQKQSGYLAAYVTLPRGDITTEQFYQLATIAREFAGGEIFTTMTQNLVLRWVTEDDLDKLYSALSKIGLEGAGVHRLGDAVGCPGAETCTQAITNSHRLALELNRSFGQRPEAYLQEDFKDISIKISGCPNSCGHHHIAAIGLHGAARRVNGRQVPHYRLLLGGRIQDGQTVFGTPLVMIPARNVPQAVERTLELYQTGRRRGETFYDWIDRVGANSLKESFQDLQQIPYPHEASEVYRDWGEESDFSVQTSESECAA